MLHRAFGAIATAVLLAVGLAHSAPVERGAIHVVDDDTIRVHGVTYRLVGFDAPETGERAHCEAERTRGAQADRRLRQILAGGGLDLQPVPCSCPQGTEGTPRCNYGRSCAVLKARGRDVASVLISEGLARPYHCGATRCPPREGWCGR
jgi:endonuclease YncB( thermonuclease family)